MKNLLISSLMILPASTLGVGGPIASSQWSPLSACEQIALTANCEDSLANLRAGAALDSTRLSSRESTLLASAQQSAPTLATMRAGAVDMSNHDWQVVGVVLLAVLLVVLIA